MNMRTAAGAWAAAAALLLAACGSGPQATPVAAAPTPSGTPVATAVAAPPSPSPTPALPAVPDFAVVAYQGDQAFGGHDGHFRDVFAAGRPVVLLYFAGL